MSITGKAKVAGVMGWPIAHSLSPALHGFWIREHALDAAYVPMAVKPENFEDAARALAQLGFRGANVTIPHKEAAFRIADEVDDAAKATGAVNTLVFEDGRIIGKNTDVMGVIGMLADAGITSLAGKSVTVFGAGGAARAVLFALTELNATQIWISNRTQAKAEELAKRFNGRGGSAVVARSNTPASDMLINATSVGMEGAEGSWGYAHSVDLRNDAVVVDIVYRPLETHFLKAFAKPGRRTVDGLGMLLHQAVPAFKAWFGIEPKVALLSHSNFGSEDTPSAAKMREVLAILQSWAPKLEVEGEMHSDAALSTFIRDEIFPHSRLNGVANLLVMPTLDAANIAFNLLKVASGAVVLGPILLGGAKPVHIVTPSITVRGLLNVSAIALTDKLAMGEAAKAG